MNVALFITCLTDNFYPRAGIAAVRVLEHLGCTVSFPQAQTCCGQPMYNNGYHPEARALARQMIDVFAPAQYVVTPSASCAAMLRESYPHLLPGDPAAAALAAKSFEFVEFLTKVLKTDLRALGVTWHGSATYHPSCHLRALGMTDHEAVTLMGQIDGLAYTPVDKPEQCCGFGGTFATKYPQISGAMARDKAACLHATRADTIICNDAGCTMNISGACRRTTTTTTSNGSSGGAAQHPHFTTLAEIIAEGLGLLPRHTVPSATPNTPTPTTLSTSPPSPSTSPPPASPPPLSPAPSPLGRGLG